MAVDDTAGNVLIFEPDTLEQLANITLPVGAAEGDCDITSDGLLGLRTAFNSNLYAIDLSDPETPVLAATIPIANFGEDVSVVPGDQFAVVVDGTGAQPVSSVSLETFTQVSTIQLSTWYTGVEACAEDRIVTGQYALAPNMRYIAIDGNGQLSDTGSSTSVTSTPINVNCHEPDADTAQGVGFSPGQVQSVLLPGFTLGPIQPLAGLGQSGVVSKQGDRYYARSATTVQAFGYNSTTGAFGAQVWSQPSSGVTFYYGMEQVEVGDNGDKVFITTPGGVQVRSADDGSLLATIPGATTPTGVCVVDRG
jgi:hypothetical protein